MVRLTKRLEDGHARVIELAWLYTPDKLYELIDRLAAYEDTGLEPEEITDLQALAGKMNVMDLVAENMRVHQEKRFVKAELADYRTLGSIDHLRVLVQAEKNWRPVVPGKPVYVVLQDGTDYYPQTNGWYISEEKIGAVSLSGFYVGEPTDGVYFPYEQIGKTIFLTKEEAEEAIKKENHNDG